MTMFVVQLSDVGLSLPDGAKKTVTTYGRRVVNEAMEANKVDGMGVEDGRSDKLGPHSDVWAIGYMVEELWDRVRESDAGLASQLWEVRNILMHEDRKSRMSNFEIMHQHPLFNPHEEELDKKTGKSPWTEDMEQLQVGARVFPLQLPV